MSRWKSTDNIEILDDILKELTAQNGDLYLKLHTNKMDFDTANAQMNYHENIAKQKILDWYFIRKRQEQT
jgi:hypothetical protein